MNSNKDEVNIEDGSAEDSNNGEWKADDANAVDGNAENMDSDKKIPLMMQRRESRTKFA
jgi:hypothetical protein